MKAKYFLFAICALAVIIACIITCGGNNKKENTSDTDVEKNSTSKSAQPLNISIYLDLSDRLMREMSPSQKDRDIAIVDYIADYFKAQTLGPEILQSKNSIKIFFYPAPNRSDIATLAEELNVDMQNYSGKDKRIALEEMKDKFTRNLMAIYGKTMADKNWPGCDIWDFFSNKDVDVQCVREGFRNILVILTDGYLFDENHKLKEGSAYSYVLPQTLQDPQSSLIIRRTGLENLEVRILEVNPYDINHRDRLKSVLENWLKGMGVKEENITVSQTDLPNNIQTVIKSFLN